MNNSLPKFGKHSAVIRIDEIESATSTKLRLRPIMESLRQADGHSIRKLSRNIANLAGSEEIQSPNLAEALLQHHPKLRIKEMPR